MTVTRRNFLKTFLYAGVGAQFFGWRSFFDHPAGIAQLQEMSGEEKILSVCQACPSACGIRARVVDGFAVKLEGSPVHPINVGALCPKGQAALEMLYNPDRIPGPLERIGPPGSIDPTDWRPISWRAAMTRITERLQSLRNAGEPHRAGFVLGETRGQMNDIFERFAAAYGTPNVIRYDSVSHQLVKTAHLLTLGNYALPAYDLENTQYILNFGGALLEAGRYSQRYINGISYSRRGGTNRSKMVTIDPRFSVTAAKSDEWLAINPGTDAMLAMGIARFIIGNKLYDENFVRNFTMGFDDFEDENGQSHQGFRSLVLSEEYDLENVERITGIESTTISRLAGEFAQSDAAIATLPIRGGLHTGNANGLYTAMAIISLNALVGNLEKPGGVLIQRDVPYAEWPPFYVDDIARTGLGQPRIDGANDDPLAESVMQNLTEKLKTSDPYSLDVLFLHHANPAYIMPNGETFGAALENVGLVVDFSSFLTETAAHADLILPDHTFMERWQDVPWEGLGFAGFGLSRPIISPPLHDTQHTGDLLLLMAAALGGPVRQALPYDNFLELLQVRTETLEDGNWDIITRTGKWGYGPHPFAEPGDEVWNELVGRDRRENYQDGRFDFWSREMFHRLSGMNPADLGIKATNDVIMLPHYEEIDYHGEHEEYPFVLNTYQLMALGDSEYTANLPTLQEIVGMQVGVRWDSWVEMEQHEAEHLELKNNDLVWVESEFGKVKTRLKTVHGNHPHVVNFPDGQGHTANGRYANGRGANPNDLLPSESGVAGTASFSNVRVKVYKA
jgi:thiosulfate reductase / polysulfide reductase chain A